jgi:uncharacterized protein YjbI with pentapeptide repeats
MEDLTKTTVGELVRRMRGDGAVRFANLDGAELAGLEVEQISFEDSSLQRTNLERLNCAGLRVINSNVQGASFDDSILYEAEFAGSDCRNASFRGARLNLAKFDNCDLSLCHFADASFFGADLSGSRLWSVDLTRTNLDGVVLDNSDLRMANLRHKTFSGTLRGVDFGQADLVGCDFTDVVFGDCTLTEVSVSPETRFDGADLRGAKVDRGLLAASCKGAIVTEEQAKELVFEQFGLIIPPENEER